MLDYHFTNTYIIINIYIGYLPDVTKSSARQSHVLAQTAGILKVSLNVKECSLTCNTLTAYIKYIYLRLRKIIKTAISNFVVEHIQPSITLPDKLRTRRM